MRMNAYVCIRVYYVPDLRIGGHYKIMAAVCLSVHLCVPQPNSKRERTKPKIHRWTPITRVTKQVNVLEQPAIPAWLFLYTPSYR